MHVITGLRQGGAEGVLTRLVGATGSDFEHLVVSLRDQGHFGPVLRAAGIPVHEIDIGGRRGAVGGLAYLLRLIRHERPKVVQTWLYHADVLGGLASRLAGVRAVAWGVRNTNLDASAISRATRCVAWLGARLSGIVPAVIVCNSTESTRVHVEFGYQARRFQVIANGYDVERFRPDPTQRIRTRAQLGAGPEDLLVGCVARWDPQKDHANLLAALRVVAARNQRVRPVLVGTRMEAGNEQLAALLQAAGLAGSAILAGPRDDIPSIMNALDLHVLASLGEAFPNVVAEAMACGTPCVVTDVGDAAHIVGATGWVAPPRNPLALAETIEVALTALQSQSRETLGERCRTRVVEHFDLQRMANSYTTLWQELGKKFQ